VPGGSTHHRGVDLPLPEGTPIYAPVNGTKVQCWWDDGGGGQVATLWVGPEKYQALHLQKGGCKSGTFDQGEVIGYTGSTGRGHRASPALGAGGPGGEAAAEAGHVAGGTRSLQSAGL
jgi:murein DD-endopeptidase MepM/ murein hydrolase activator NlpD